MNVSSIVVLVLPKNYDEVQKLLEESGVCEYHFGDKEKGKMIVTVEEVQVAWSSADGVTVEQIHEVRQQIMAYEAEIEASTQK